MQRETTLAIKTKQAQLERQRQECLEALRKQNEETRRRAEAEKREKERIRQEYRQRQAKFEQDEKEAENRRLAQRQAFANSLAEQIALRKQKEEERLTMTGNERSMNTPLIDEMQSFVGSYGDVLADSTEVAVQRRTRRLPRAARTTIRL